MFSRALYTLRASLRLHETSQLQPSALIHPRNMSLVTEKRNIVDHKLRLFAAKYKVRRRLYGALSSDPELPPNIRDKHRYNLSKLPRNRSFTRVTN